MSVTDPSCKIGDCFTGHIAERQICVDVVIELDAGGCMDDKLDFWQQALLILLADATVRLCQISWYDFKLVKDLQVYTSILIMATDEQVQTPVAHA